VCVCECVCYLLLRSVYIKELRAPKVLQNCSLVFQVSVCMYVCVYVCVCVLSAAALCVQRGAARTQSAAELLPHFSGECNIKQGESHASGHAFLGWARTIYSYVFMVQIRYFEQGNYNTYGHIRCVYTVLVNPMHFPSFIMWGLVYAACVGFALPNSLPFSLFRGSNL